MGKYLVLRTHNNFCSRGNEKMQNLCFDSIFTSKSAALDLNLAVITLPMTEGGCS